MPISLQCYECKHYIDGVTCMAFEKIPEEIYTGEFDHTEPYPGDQGYRYEKLELEEEEEGNATL